VGEFQANVNDLEDQLRRAIQALEAARAALDDARQGEAAAQQAVREAMLALDKASKFVMVVKAYYDRLARYHAWQEELRNAQAAVDELLEKVRQSEALLAEKGNLGGLRDALTAARKEEKEAHDVLANATTVFNQALQTFKAAESRVRGEVTAQQLKDAESAMEYACGHGIESAKTELADAREAEADAANRLRELKMLLQEAIRAHQRAVEIRRRYEIYTKIEEQRSILSAALSDAEARFKQMEQSMEGACGQALEYARQQKAEALALLQKAEASMRAREMYLLKMKEYNLCLDFLASVCAPAVAEAASSSRSVRRRVA